MIGLLLRSFEIREKNGNNVELTHKNQDGTCKSSVELCGTHLGRGH